MNQLPVTIRRSIELIGLCALGLIIVLGKVVIMPLLVALFISLLLLPVLRWLRKHKVPEVLAIILCIVAVFLLVAGVATFLSVQIGGLVSDIDAIKKNVNLHWGKLSSWISGNLHFSLKEQVAMIEKQGAQMGNNVTDYLQGAFSSLGSILIFVGLLPVYIFFTLFYRNMFYRFVLYWFPKDKYALVNDTVGEVEVIVKYYLGGLLIQITYLAVLVGGTLLLFGVKHAILIGVTFAILNLIPYLGPLIGNLVGIILTLTASQNFTHVFIVLITIAIVQFFDNNIIFPRIVGSKVKINALASIVGIVIGGTIAGIPGMFLSIPIMAILKIIFDKSDHLKQWGILLGEDDQAKSTNPQLKELKDDLAEERKEVEGEIREKR